MHYNILLIDIVLTFDLVNGNTDLQKIRDEIKLSLSNISCAETYIYLH